MNNQELLFYSLQLRLVKGQPGDPAGQKVELIALPEGPGEPRRAHFEQWEPLSHRLSAVTSSTPFHLKVIYRTLHAGLTASLIDRATGNPANLFSPSIERSGFSQLVPGCSPCGSHRKSQNLLYAGFRTDYGGTITCAPQEEQMPEKQQRVLEYEAAGASDQGRTRKTNEDVYGLSLNNREGACNFVVCDGMGGAAAGEVASRMAVEAMLHAMSQGALTRETFQQAVDAANHSVHRSAEQDPARAGMGTTLVAMATRGNHAWVAHVGDSRCYRLRDGKLERLTHDHSLVDEQVRLGQLTPAQAETSPMRNVITRAVGTQDEVDADVIEFAVAPGDLYLLASDGLMREVDDERIAGILRASEGLEETCAKLIRAANEAGGRDNITCVLARAR